jgi:hypothetical protein
VNDFEVLEDLKRSSTVLHRGCGKRWCTQLSISQFRRALNRFWPEFHGYYLVGELREESRYSQQFKMLGLTVGEW